MVGVIATLLMLAGGTPQVAHSADNFPATVRFSSNELMLNGVGKRKKAFLTLYNAGLYLTTKSAVAADIIGSDTAMAVGIRIVSSLISSERMDDALAEGFEKSTEVTRLPLLTE